MSVRSAAVSLVVMPFGPVFQPALGASILREALARAGLHARIEYLSARFVDVIGLAEYEKISEFYPDSRKLFGEWVFSHLLYPGKLSVAAARRHLAIESYRDTRHFEAIERLCERVGGAGDAIRSFFDEAAEEVLAPEPKVLGFTSMFQQHTASLALAKRVKALSPETFIVFGGANAEGAMGLETLRAFGWVDAVVSGAGEVALPAIAQALAAGRPPPPMPGVSYRGARHPEGGPGQAPELPLDDIPPVGFDDFFAVFAGSPSLRAYGVAPSVLVETSRGCWWGQKHHCTFCGLNGAQMRFRAKSPERAVRELKTLAASYPGSRIVVTDNIMPQSYYREVLPYLKKSEFPAGMFFEIKSNVTEEQVSDLAAAGVDVVQVGIENFSQPVLDLMKKGVSGIGNVACLKYCATHDVAASWILLTGFPGETEADYDHNERVVRLIRHLRPPQVCSEIRIDRFSPNHTDPARYGFSAVTPVSAYAAIYRDPEIRLQDLAYYFDGVSPGHERLAARRARLAERVEEWQRQSPPRECWVVATGAEDLVLDAREGLDRLAIWRLDAPSAAILRGCEAKVPVHALGRELAPAEAAERIAALEEAGILFREAGAALALPLRVGRAARRPSALLVDALASRGRVTTGNGGRLDLDLVFAGQTRPGLSPLGGAHDDAQRRRPSH